LQRLNVLPAIWWPWRKKKKRRRRRRNENYNEKKMNKLAVSK
jgi:hypothetical protein